MDATHGEGEGVLRLRDEQVHQLRRLEQAGCLQLSLSYGGTGRPVAPYTWVSPQVLRSMGLPRGWGRGRR
ncbi:MULTISPECIES: hypothetical protein [Streptomyces]|uniref:hypothetical protein n=1 Tax=Streptomyces TaxID=1883 RepID=UPI000A5006C4|nr:MULTISPECIES: hypothetical protein [Streptomyces]MCH0558749.1 hypothetical protein [Streptomyces sp. MUM 16J]